MTVKIVDYDHSYAAGVAQMWNESDAAWPWSFTGGIPMTAEFVRDWMDDTDYISLQVAVEQEQVLGFCLVTVYPNERDCCYVQLLNVSPASHGKGVGRDLLKRAVEAAAAGNYRRIDLNTWASNKKAVPLYKKCGFFWLEDTSVYMQNFVPAIMNTDAGRDFFARHDWYSTTVRDLDVVEDKEQFHGNASYRYKWQADGDVLEVVIDRDSQAITALGTKEFFAAAWAEPKPMTNSPLQVYWRLENRSDRELSYALVASGQKGVEGSFQQGGNVRDELEFSAAFKIGEEAGPSDKPRRVPASVSSSLVVNNQPLRLVTGIRPMHPVQINTGPEHPAVASGSETVVVVNLKEMAGKAVQGRAQFAGSGVEANPKEIDFSLSAQETTGVQLTIRGRESGVGRLVISIQTDAGQELSEVVPVAVLGNAPVCYRQGKKLVSQNSRLRVELDLKGGRAELYDRATGKLALAVSAPAVGPNYWPSEFLGSEGEPILTTETLGVRFRSVHQPELEVERRVWLREDRLLVQNRLLNRGARELKVSLAQNGHLDWLGGEEHLYLPQGDEVVHQRMVAGGFPAFDNEFPDETESMAQHWLAVTMPGSGQVGGFAWTGAAKHKLYWGQAEPYYNLTIPAGESVSTPELYAIWASGDWRAVQRHWQQLARRQAKQLPLRPVVTIDAQAETGDGQELAVSVYNRRNRSLSGSLHLRSQACSVEPSLLNVKDACRKHPGRYQCTVRGRTGLASVEAVLETPLLTYRRTLPLLIAADAPVQIERGETWTLNNGALALTVSPEFGLITNLLGAGSGQLDSNWPEPAAIGPLNPWYGGIHPVLYPLGFRFPGKLHKADQVQMVKIGRWQGMELRWSRFSYEQLAGLELRVQYLLLPGVNVLAVVRELLNPAGVALTCNWGLAMTPGNAPQAVGYPGFDGSNERLRLGNTFTSVNSEGYLDVYGSTQLRVVTRERVTAVNYQNGLILQIMAPTPVALQGNGVRRVDYLVFGDPGQVTELTTSLDGSE